MNGSSLLSSSQSGITNPKTQPPTQTTIIASETQTQDVPKRPLNYNSLFGQDNNKIPDHACDVENDLEKEKDKHESKDDWVINDNNNVNEKRVNIEVPSFIRLFVIRRIVDKYIKNNYNNDKKNKTKEEIIKEMTNVFK